VEPEFFLDPLDFLRALYVRDIPYVLVGRQALVLLGAPLMTADYDFYMSPEPEHLRDLRDLAEELGLELSTKDPEARPFFSLLSDNLKLDFFRCRSYPTGGGEALAFEDLFRRKKVIAVDDFAVYVPSIEDLILTKKARGAPKDLEDIKYLEVLLEREQR